MLRLAAAIVAGCALIGQAHADPMYSPEEATNIVALAMLVDAQCPGAHLNRPKAEKMMLDHGLMFSVLVPATDGGFPSFEPTQAIRDAQIDFLKHFGPEGDQPISHAMLCLLARIPSSAGFHYLLQFEQ